VSTTIWPFLKIAARMIFPPQVFLPHSTENRCEQRARHTPV
jgi:hypothetical protein